MQLQNRINHKNFSTILSTGAFLISISLWAAPPRPAMEVRVQAADLILIVQVDRVEIKDFNEISRTAHLELRNLQNLKGAGPKKLNLAFLVFPETFENHLREPVPEGKYIVFLNYKKVASEDKPVLVPATPRQFAFLDYKQSTLVEIHTILDK